ncbi:MAG: hypothetical protein ACJ74Y_11850 [Bryobacteraceae bacterium]
MKHIATVALLLNLGAAGLYAHEKPVNMRFSGSSAFSTVNLQQPNTNTAEENVAGKGTLGSFTFRTMRAIANSPATSDTCSGPSQLYFPSVSGAGIFRFQDGSLLKVNLIQGGDCIDLVAFEGHCTLSLQIIGGTGRFKNASGMLTFTETAVPVLADASNNPVFFTEKGEFTGTISGMDTEEERQDERE